MISLLAVAAGDFQAVFILAAEEPFVCQYRLVTCESGIPGKMYLDYRSRTPTDSKDI